MKRVGEFGGSDDFGKFIEFIKKVNYSEAFLIAIRCGLGKIISSLPDPDDFGPLYGQKFLELLETNNKLNFCTRRISVDLEKAILKLDWGRRNDIKNTVNNLAVDHIPNE